MVILHHHMGSHSLALGTACETEADPVVSYFHTEASSTHFSVYKRETGNVFL
ncbi:clathrin, heavy polypeptide (Hc), isoform CRA_c [Rattus norvegicus]|uniref:Clathrin, heavy polypeptide (Hc), isoform CRA_c n=1 Tax=Rattus norvegicus TaxID=10116 RepID=A6HHR8_RAT|nr:clathrin, heavy polypeptide (Hc), isoform CRA_c [Rattus norvegicus]